MPPRWALLIENGFALLSLEASLAARSANTQAGRITVGIPGTRNNEPDFYQFSRKYPFEYLPLTPITIVSRTARGVPWPFEHPACHELNPFFVYVSHAVWSLWRVLLKIRSS